MSSLKDRRKEKGDKWHGKRKQNVRICGQSERNWTERGWQNEEDETISLSISL